jgi:hypothetical protein
VLFGQEDPPVCHFVDLTAESPIATHLACHIILPCRHRLVWGLGGVQLLCVEAAGLSITAHNYKPACSKSMMSFNQHEDMSSAEDYQCPS